MDPEYYQKNHPQGLYRDSYATHHCCCVPPHPESRQRVLARRNATSGYVSWTLWFWGSSLGLQCLHHRSTCTCLPLEGWISEPSIPAGMDVRVEPEEWSLLCFPSKCPMESQTWPYRRPTKLAWWQSMLISGWGGEGVPALFWGHWEWQHRGRGKISEWLADQHISCFFCVYIFGEIIGSAMVSGTSKKKSK